MHSLEACKSIHEWRGLLRELASRAPTRFSAFRVLCGGARGGLTKLGVFSSLFSFPAPDDSSSGPSRARVQELLPLPPAAAARHLRSLGQDISDYNLGLTAETLCNCAVHCLNFLSCAGWTSKPILLRNKSSLSKVQEMSLTHLWDSILQFLEFGDEEFSLEKITDELNSKVTSYGGEIVSVRRNLICDLVLPAWPKLGEACVLPIEDFVTQELRDDLLDPYRCLLPEDEWPKVPPKSKVHATDSEWYALVKEGVERKIFGEISYDQIFKDKAGNPVLNGAMGVDKIKEVNGKQINLLRFICILVPINTYLRKLRGDSNLLPFLPQLSLLALEPNELLYIDSEDMLSCFNLFKMPDSWAGFFAFEKPVSSAVFGKDANSVSYVYMRAVPMGWLGAVDVMQAMARRLIFKDCGVSPGTELRKDSNLPEGDVSIVCMDGFDFIRRVKVLGDMFDAPSRKRSDEMESFINTCRGLGLPLNASKQLIHGLRASVLGGEIDGFNGRIMHSREKGHEINA